MLTAEEAKKLVKEKQEHQLEELVQAIERAAKAGKRLTFSDTYLTMSQTKELEDAGYKVTESTANECHKIEW